MYTFSQKSLNKLYLNKIVSGGQTGVDRAALDVAIEFNILHGGWCPKGRLAEDGQIDKKYALQETDSSEWSVRTEKNVLDSDGTLIIVDAPPMGGTELTINLAKKHSKPYLIFDASSQKDLSQIIQWLSANKIYTLNVAGPRASQSKNIYTITTGILKEVIISCTPQLQIKKKLKISP